MSDHAWSYGPDSQHLPGTDLTGFRVEALDGRIGRIDEASEEVDPAHVVVDTRRWIFGHQVVLPSECIERVDADDRRVYVGWTKAEVRHAPQFVPGGYEDDAPSRSEIGRYYDSGGTGGLDAPGRPGPY
ncbi:PRC-barrel domain containing protein [Allostreptomyces psammosilenae]|uniref:PRC-barrel domain containing protein n=1 Tax=Allostreptomyces psammosilenae TaxID=1892865 RepID=A0A852ZUP7_9ACTN|nr:PRC-barrel domain containing protein [Allostreptomyces psammosilenae]NYI05999.1 hypothetical protein [Allostreptomyces psammosilenae]